jgi:acyl-coenzyme A thioesterase PaaI-like protein
MDDAALEAAGWTRLPTSAFSAAIGPTWMKGEAGGRRVALVAHEGIVNDYGSVVHGGALMTFADIALGVGAADAIAGHSYVTVQLQYQFAGGVPTAAWSLASPNWCARPRRSLSCAG